MGDPDTVLRLAKPAWEHDFCVWRSVQRANVREILPLLTATSPGLEWRSPYQAARGKAHSHWVVVRARHGLDIARCRTKPTCRLAYRDTACRPFYLAHAFAPGVRPWILALIQPNTALQGER